MIKIIIILIHIKIKKNQIMTFITIKIIIRQIRNDIIMKQKMNIKKKKNFMVMKIQKNMIEKILEIINSEVENMDIINTKIMIIIYEVLYHILLENLMTIIKILEIKIINIKTNIKNMKKRKKLMKKTKKKR